MGGASLYEEFDRFKDAKECLIKFLDTVEIEGEAEGWAKVFESPVCYLIFRCASIEYDYKKKKFIVAGRIEK